MLNVEPNTTFSVAYHESHLQQGNTRAGNAPRAGTGALREKLSFLPLVYFLYLTGYCQTTGEVPFWQDHPQKKSGASLIFSAEIMDLV